MNIYILYAVSFRHYSFSPLSIWEMDIPVLVASLQERTCYQKEQVNARGGTAISFTAYEEIVTAHNRGW